VGRCRVVSQFEFLLCANCGHNSEFSRWMFGEGQLPVTQDDITALEVFSPALDARLLRRGHFLRRPAMAFGELYEFLEVVLSVARPQETICSKEIHVSHLHHLHAWRPEAGRN
jgi:hypothetical protein